MHLPEIDLPKVANVAGSAMALIIATAIFLSWVSARYVPVFERLRSLTGELRGTKDQTRRRDGVREQINDYRRRLRLMNRATGLLCWVLVLAVLTLIIASTTVAFPPKEELTGGQGAAVKALAAAGAATMLAAFVLDVIAVGLMMWENRIDRQSIESEVGDIDEVDGGH